MCTNPSCSAKKIKSFTLFVSRDALNIDGLSEATLEKFIAHGFIHTYADIFQLERYREEIISLDGFGEKSYQNLMESIHAAAHTTLSRLIYSLGIPGIGAANAKMICRSFQYDLERIRNAAPEALAEVDGIGEVLAGAVAEYFHNEENDEALELLLKELVLEQPQEENLTEQTLTGKTFVITGTVERFANRNELKAYIESKGGKVTGSVTKKTDYLINNDSASGSSKNKKAKELSIPIISEEEFLKL